MARGVTLEQLVTDLRAESLMSTDPAQGLSVRPALVRSLQRAQRVLYQSHDWNDLKRDWRIPLRAGQRYYDVPDGLSPEKLNLVSAKWGNSKVDLERGIGFDEYDAFESQGVASTASFTITAGAACSSTGSLTINGGTAGAANYADSITVDGTEILGGNVLWLTSHSATAAAIAVSINSATATTGYTASSTGPIVYIYADPNLGDSADGREVLFTGAGDVTATSLVDLAGGADNFITSVKVNNVEILDGNIGWRTSNVVTAAAVAAKITSTVSFPEYTATAEGNKVVVSASPDVALTSNALTMTVTVSGSTTAGTPTVFAGGVSVERSDPPQAWDIKETGTVAQIEVWPVPASNDSTLQLQGERSLLPLVLDTDVCTLDSDLIVLHAAVEHTKDKDRKIALTAAATGLMTYLTSNQAKGTSKINMASGGARSGRQAPGPIRTAIRIESS